MEINGHEISTTLISQLQTLAGVISEKKAQAIGNMRETVEAMHLQGTLLVQAEMELGDAFDAFVEQLGDHGVDPEQARYTHKLAKKHPKLESLLSSPGQIKQLTLQNFAPATEQAAHTEGERPAFTLAFHLNIDPMDWSKELRAEFLTKAKPVVKLVGELEC